MTRTIEQANREIAQVGRMPYGLARTQAAEQQVRLAETEGPRQVLPYALNELVEAYVWGNEVEKAYVPFTKAVRLYDEAPELFDAQDTHGLFWSFKWMVGHLSDYPTIPAEQIEATLADMERRYAVAGYGRDAIAGQAFQWARMRGAAEADALFEEWVRTPRDEFSQCRACDPGDKANYLAERGDHDEAVRLIESTLADGETCATEPADMLSTLALLHLDAGRAREAAAVHRRAVAALAGTSSDMSHARGNRFLLLARGGQTARALRSLAEDAHLLLEADTPGARFQFLTDVVAGTSALLPGAADTPVALDGIPATDLAGLRDWCVQQATALAAGFDARNGTDRFARTLVEALETRPAPVPLDLAVIPAGAVDGTRGAAVPASDGIDVGPLGPLGSDPTSIPGFDGPVETAAERAERLVAAGDLVGAASAWLEASADAEAQGRLGDAGLALAEAARCAQEAGDEDGAASTYPAAVARMRAGGVPPETTTRVVVAWAPVAAATGTTDAVLPVIDAVVADLDAADRAPLDLSSPSRPAGFDDAMYAEQVERARGCARAELHDTAARVLASLGPDRVDDALARATRAAESFGNLGYAADAAHAFLLAGRLHEGLGHVDEAVWCFESAMEGFDLACLPAQRGDAASALVAVLRAAGRDDQAETVLRTLTR